MTNQTFNRLINNEIFTRLTWLRFIGFEFWMVGFTPFFIGYVVSSKELYSFDLFYGFLIIAILTSSTFVLNHICDIELDKKNPRKEFSLLVRGSVSLKTSWILFWILQLSCIILSLRFNLEFLYCILGLTAISFAYNMEPFRFKSRPGLDLVSNGLSLGLLIPLAAWSIDQPLLEFPKLFFLSTICYLLALYCPTMAIDVEFDKSFGIQTFATKFGAEFTMKLSWFFTICGVSILLISGYFEIYPWNFNLLIWTGWLLIIEIFVHYFYLPITPNPTYNVVAKGSIILATFEAAATFIFLIIFLS
ncbi:MAG: UbiA prenyltransferase family protein [Candidatus Thermoplasmatota archaeon]|jgi:4-hydroxybenzoate polyprenyltransferase|nr:UbiA prenyltransferase family protein [Candidatus Thermoplasmatota archaeon]MEC8077166.1 UbiA prenyltransferase family protein [Candidatus Thermoplasmatota archaeon]